MAEDIKLTATWFEPSSYSRFKTWNYADTIVTNWLRQKGYVAHKKSLLYGFAKLANTKCSYTDTLILAHQNFKAFRKFSNLKIQEREKLQNLLSELPKT